MENESENNAPKVHPMHAFKDARRQHLHESEAPKRELRAKMLAELKAKIDVHAGAGVTEGMIFDLESESPPGLVITAPQHIPVRVRFQGDKLEFLVHRKFMHKAFDNLADALIFGEPLSFQSTAPAPESFDTREPTLMPNRRPMLPSPSLPTPHKAED